MNTITDEEYEGILACFTPEDVPKDPLEARQAIENFVNLIELLMRPLPLPPPGGSSFRDPASNA
jgi:hypothetical protein